MTFVTEIEILNNWNRLFELIQQDSRTGKLSNLYTTFEERIALAPASTNPTYHNAFAGGYVDHVLRVYDFAVNLYTQWKDMNMDISGFTIDELKFCAINHDLGKIGFLGEGNEYYLPNDNNWEVEKRNKIYKTNSKLQYMSLADMSLFLLQQFEIQLSFNEWHAIRVHDGPYEELNKTYYMNFFTDGKFKTNLPYILHYADLMAMRFEYQRYINSKTDNYTYKPTETFNKFENTKIDFDKLWK